MNDGSTPRSLRDVFVGTAGHGQAIALVYRDERITYAELWRRSVSLAHALRAAKVDAGDRVAIAMRNYPEWPVAFWATQLIGAVAVPLNAWMTAPELASVVTEAEPVAVVADEERLALLPEPAYAGIRLAIAVRSTGSVPGAVSLESFTAPHATAAEPPDAAPGPQDIATIIFTSGTTGRPKGVLGSHWNHVVGLLGKLARAPRPSEGSGGTLADVTKLVTFPFFHVAGLNTMLTAAIAGQKAVLMHKWDAQEALRLIEEEHVAEMAGAPFVIRTLLDAAATTERDLSSLVSVGTGGSSTPANVIERIDAVFGGRVSPRTGYGMTETTTGVAAIWGADLLAHPTSSGRPLPTAQIAILGDDGRPVPTGAVGEIAVRGPQVSPGYFRDEGSARAEDDYFRTKDLGRFDEDGFLYVVGRMKDIVVRGSENINCAEVEATLHSHPDVLEAAVFGIPHPSLGEELCAIVRPQDGRELDVDQLKSFVAGRLAGFKVPSRIAVVPAPIPRTPTGKVVKAGLVEATGLEEYFRPTAEL